MSKMLETLHAQVPGQGTKLMVNTRVYNFAPNQYGHFVAECLNETDRDSILSIGAGYRAYDPIEDYPDLKLAPPPEQSRIPNTRTVQATPKRKNPIAELAARKAGKKPKTRAPAQLAVDPAQG